MTQVGPLERSEKKGKKRRIFAAQNFVKVR